MLRTSERWLRFVPFPRFSWNYHIADTANRLNPRTISFYTSFLVTEPQLSLGNQKLAMTTYYLVHKSSILWDFWENFLKTGNTPFASHSISPLPVKRKITQSRHRPAGPRRWKVTNSVRRARGNQPFLLL